MHRSWHAEYYPASTGHGTSVEVTLTPEGVQFEPEPTLWPYDEVVQTSGAYPGERVRLERSGDMLVIEDRAFLIAASQHAPHLRQTVPDPPVRRSLLIIIAAYLLAFALLLLGAWLLLSYAARAAGA